MAPAGDDPYDDYDYDPDDDDGSGPAPPQPRAAAIRQAALAKRNPQTAAKRQGRGRKSSPNRILAKEKQRKALELRKAGASFDTIADQLGYADASGAYRAVQTAMKVLHQEPALELRTVQVERLNHMLLTLWPKVQNGDERAIDTSLRVMDKIDRLMGTDAAQQVDVNINQNNAILVVDGDKDDYLRALKQMAGINGDGTNASQHAIGPASAPPTGIIEGSVVEDNRPLSETLTSEAIDTIHQIMAPPHPPDGGLGPDPEPIPYVSEEKPAKTYRFGVDP